MSFSIKENLPFVHMEKGERGRECGCIGVREGQGIREAWI